MSGCLWEEINKFHSLGEYNRFVQWLECQRDSGQCVELPEPEGDSSNFSKNRRFKCVSTDRIWKLSCPDPGYFPGSWRPEKFGDEIPEIPGTEIPGTVY